MNRSNVNCSKRESVCPPWIVLRQVGKAGKESEIEGATVVRWYRTTRSECFWSADLVYITHEFRLFVLQKFSGCNSTLLHSRPSEFSSDLQFEAAKFGEGFVYAIRQGSRSCDSAEIRCMRTQISFIFEGGHSYCLHSGSLCTATLLLLTRTTVQYSTSCEDYRHTLLCHLQQIWLHFVHRYNNHHSRYIQNC